MRVSSNTLVFITLGLFAFLDARKVSTVQQNLATLQSSTNRLGFFDKIFGGKNKTDNSSSSSSGGGGGGSSSSSSSFDQQDLLPEGAPDIENIYANCSDSHAFLPPLEFLNEDGEFTFEADFFDQFSPVKNVTEWNPDLVDEEGNIVIPDEYLDDNGNYTFTPEQIEAYISDEEYPGLAKLLKKLIYRMNFTIFPEHPDDDRSDQKRLREGGQDGDEDSALKPEPLEPNGEEEGSGDGNSTRRNGEQPHRFTMEALKSLGLDYDGANLPPLNFLTPDGNFSLPGDFYEEFPPESVDSFPDEWLAEGAVAIPDEYLSEGNWTMPLDELFLYFNDEAYPGPGEHMTAVVVENKMKPFPQSAAQDQKREERKARKQEAAEGEEGEDVPPPPQGGDGNTA